MALLSGNTDLLDKAKLEKRIASLEGEDVYKRQVFNECSNTAGAYNPIFYISKVCLCTTNCNLYHKDPCPERGLNHSEVVIIIYPLSYFKVVSKKQDYSGIPSFRVFDDEKGCPNMYFK